MSLEDWADWNSRTNRKRETIREDVPRPCSFDPITVTEESLSDTAVTRIRQWIVGRKSGD